MSTETVSLNSLLNALRAAGEQTRLRLLAILRKNELTVSELTRILGQSAPRVSRHLKLLCENHLLERHQEGSWVFYRIADRGPAAHIVRAVMKLLPQNDDELVRDKQRLEVIRQEHSTAASNYFQKNARKWDAIRQLIISEEKIEEQLLHAVADRKIDLLLDLGTGTGRMLEIFSALVFRGLGVDFSREMLTVARANLEAADIGNCQVRHGDITNLQIASDSVEVAVIHHVLHFLDDPAAAISEAVRVLVPGGRLLIVDFSPHQLEILRDEHAHRRLGFADDEVTTWLENAGASLQGLRRLSVEGGEVDRNSLTVSVWIAEVDSKGH